MFASLFQRGPQVFWAKIWFVCCVLCSSIPSHLAFNMPSNTSNFESKKGSPIQIVGGGHSGCSGWIDKSRYTSNCYIPVIIKKGNREQETQTKVKHENYILNTELKVPITYKRP